MDSSNMKDIGEVIRRVRKSKSLRLEDLADENISPATISNIERGISHVNLSKIHYLLNKLKINLDEVPGILMKQEKEAKEMHFIFQTIDIMIDLGRPEDALTMLDELQIEDNHHSAARVQHLKGKAFLTLKKWNRAERYLAQAISLSNQNQNKDNIEAGAFLDLSLCLYHQNEIEKALEIARSGLDAYVEGPGQEFYKHTLIRNQAIFLMRLGRNVEALKVVQDIWDGMDDMKDMDTVITFYKLRAEILRKTGLVDESIKFATQGLELAKINRDFKNIFLLLIELGHAYTTKQQWKQAEHCFNTGLALQKYITDGNYLTYVYTGLGILFVQQGRNEEAKGLFQQAISKAEEYNNAPRLTYALRLMGDYCKSIESKQNAIPYYQRALEIAQKFNYKRAEHQLHLRLSQCHQENNQQEFEKSLLNIYKTQIAIRGEENGILEDE
ncbi:tetratricopeptide repeat protein [Marininema halotolerans]|uniref:Helix-turn-helix n=1 Tax=Marininema halotolerans TaxID=1155944 RepID=A0A1I6UJY5_9BACL|nr:tetratricopeptide repeat protein [Marininema halotolerans]SFT01769.1 Helix-turn-helix [Marininema halotolerans]